MHDDELTAALRHALVDPVADIDERRVDAIRAAAAARQQETAAERSPEAPTNLEDRRQARRRFVPITAVAATILLVVGGAIALQSTRDDTTSDGLEYAGPISGPAGSGELRVVKTGIGRVIDLDTEALDILPTGEFYEMWFVADTDTSDTPNRISAGTFHPDLDGRSQVTFAAAVDPAKFPTIEITAEPADGNPAPSGTTVMSADVPQG